MRSTHARVILCAVVCGAEESFIIPIQRGRGEEAYLSAHYVTSHTPTLCDQDIGGGKDVTRGGDHLRRNETNDNAAAADIKKKSRGGGKRRTR